MKIKAIDISKLAIYGIFLNYYCYYIIRGSFIPMSTYLFFAVALVGVIISALKQPIRFCFEINCWIAYFITSVITIAVAYSASEAIEGLSKFLQRLVLIILIAYICEKEKSIVFAIRLLAVTAVACAMSSLLMMNDFSQKLQVESGASVSTNDIGSLMAYGCFAILFAFGVGEKSKAYTKILKVLYVVAALSVISIAGSRKSIIAIAILFGAMLIFCWKDFFKKMTSLQFVSILIVAVIAVYVVYVYLLPYFEDTNLYVRVFGRGAERTAESDEGRLRLYESALKDFKDHFMFGLGFNNYKSLHGIYTHSTYVEPLACSGIFGLLYLIPYVSILVKQIKLSFSKDEKYVTENRVFQKEMLAFYISFLFVAIGIPYIYKDIPCIVLAMFIAWQNINLGTEMFTIRKRNYGEVKA